MKEEELVTRLHECPQSAVLVDRIFCRNPYSLMYKEPTNLKRHEIERRYDEWIRMQGAEWGDFILFLPKNFGRRTMEWLSENIPIINSTKEQSKLKDHHGDLFDYFRKQNEARLEKIRVFSKHEDLAKDKGKVASLKDILA